MADLGAYGLSEGIKGFLTAYQQSKGSAQEQALKKKQMQLEGIKSGIVDVDESGQPIYTPEKLTEIETKKGLLDPKSAASKREQDFQLGLLRTSGFDPQKLAEFEPQLRAMPAAELQKDAGGVKGLVAGQYGIAKGQAFAAPKWEGLEQGKQKQAIDAGKDFENNSRIKTARTAIQNVDRAIGIGEGKAKMNPQIFNALQQDYINSLAPGGAATEGKMNREMVETIMGQFADIQQKYGSNYEDFRKANPQAFNNLMDNIKQTRQEWKDALHDSVLTMKATYDTNKNPGVQETVKRKIGELAPEVHKDVYGEEYKSKGREAMKARKESELTSEDDEALKWANEHLNDPANTDKAYEILKRLGKK